MTAPDPLSSLLAYYEPLSQLRRDLRGVPTLLTPGSPLLGANAAYLRPGPDLRDPAELVPLLRAWQLAQDTPPVVASAGPLPQLQPIEQEALRVGVYRAGGQVSPIVVEQVSRLHLSSFAAVLAESQGMAEWAGPLGRSLAAPLERIGTGATLLMAYAGGEALGAALLHGSAAHLWGTLDEAADAPLLSAAAQLVGGELWTSLLDDSPLSLEGTGAAGGGEVWFSLLP